MSSAVTVMRERLRRLQEHAVAHVRRAGDRDAKADAREDECVVALADPVALAVVDDRVERAARGDDRPAVATTGSPVRRVHSLFDVGFDSGKIIGRSLSFAISRTTLSENVPGVAETPIRIVGLAFAIVSSSVIFERSLQVQVATSATSRAKSALKSSRPARSLTHSPLRVDRPDPLVRLLAA